MLEDREMVHRVGLWYVMVMPSVKFHLVMLMTLMERLDANTSTFSYWWER